MYSTNSKPQCSGLPHITTVTLICKSYHIMPTTDLILNKILQTKMITWKTNHKVLRSTNQDSYLKNKRQSQRFLKPSACHLRKKKIKRWIDHITQSRVVL